MTKLKIILIYIFLCCINELSFAQQLSFDHLTTYNGLSQNSVLSITQDYRGFMWFGTAHGLNRYDGTGFKKYIRDSTKKNTISNDYINRVFADSKKTLWVATSRGLNKINLETNKIDIIPVSTQEVGVSSLETRFVYEDREGSIWVGTANGLNLLTDREKMIFTKFYADELQGLAGNYVRCIFEDNENSIWVGTTNGLTRIKRINNSYEFKSFRHDQNDVNSLSSNDISAIVQDASHDIWVGTSHHGLNLLDKNTGTFSHITMRGVTSKSVRDMVTDREGRLWIGSLEGLYILDPISRTDTLFRHHPLDPASLSQNSIYSIFHDVTGSSWIGTYYGGINVSHPYTNSFSIWRNDNSKNSLTSNVVSGIVEDEKQNLWVSTEGGGLNYIDRKKGITSVYMYDSQNPKTIGSNKVKTVYKDKDGNIWAGTTSGGLNLFNPQSKSFIRFMYDPANPATQDTEVTTVFEDSHKRFWVGTRQGLKLFKKINNTLLPDTTDMISGAIAIAYINTIIEDSKNNIWFGTYHGLFLLKKNETNFNQIIGLGSVINCLYEDKKGNLWAGIFYAGLAKYTPSTGKIARYNIELGLPGNQVLSIHGDGENYIWMATDIGLRRLNVTSNTFRTFNPDGLLIGGSIKNSFYKSNTGEFFFGCQNGLVSFFPGKIQINRYIAPLVFTSLRLHNSTEVDKNDKLLSKDISLTDEIRLRYYQNAFTINFALLSFVAPEKNTYSYKLEGIDKDWNRSGNTFITYNHLPTGKYRLIVKGANSDGVWSKPTMLSIVILPPVWQTWWAILIYIAVFSLMLFFVVRYFFKRELKKINGFQTAEN